MKKICELILPFGFGFLFPDRRFMAVFRFHILCNE